MGFLTPEGNHKMHARIGYIRNLAEGGNHRLLFIVHGIEASCAQNNEKQRHKGNHTETLQLFLADIDSAGLSRRGCPFVSSVFYGYFFFFHVTSFLSIANCLTYFLPPGSYGQPTTR